MRARATKFVNNAKSYVIRLLHPRYILLKKSSITAGLKKNIIVISTEVSKTTFL